MTGSPHQHSELPFKYVGGNPAIDLVNTVDWTSAGLREERLEDYEDLARWAEGAGIISPKAGAALRRAAFAHPQQAVSAHRTALRGRTVLARLFREISEGAASAEAVADFNRLLGPAIEHLRLFPAQRSGRKAVQYELGWESQEKTVDSILWPVVWSAALLITSNEASRIRVCGGDDCGWMYVDRSRNGLRRWCQMETCGTREKSRRRRLG
jgi:predicted RNA-binding Zn ribbon-like protein